MDEMMQELYDALLPNIPEGAKTFAEIYRQINDTREANGLRRLGDSTIRNKLKESYKSVRVGNLVYWYKPAN